MKVPNWIYSLRDRFWPTVEPQEAKLKSSEDLIQIVSDTASNVLPVVNDLIEAEEHRKDSIESRLQGLLQFASISATLVLGIVAFIVDLEVGSAGQSEKPFILYTLVAVLGGAVYIIIQFLAAVFFSIVGLERRAYLGLSVRDVIQKEQESKEDYLERITQSKLEQWHVNGEVTNAKIDQLARAHQAVKNALVGLVLMVTILAGMAIYNNI